jgi:hypothetical protein
MRNKSFCENCEYFQPLYTVWCDPITDSEGQVIRCKNFKRKQTIIQTILNTITFKKNESK